MDLRNDTMNFDRLHTILKKRRSQGETYESIARSFPAEITRAHVWHIIERDWEPEAPHLRLALGLPALKPAPCCPKCGDVHTTKRCTRKSKQRKYRDLWAMPQGELLRRLEERAECDPAG